MRLSFTARESERERAKLTEPDAQASLRLCPLNSSPGGDRHPQIFQPYLGSTRNLVWKVICAKKKNPKGSLCKERPFREHYKIVLYLYTHTDRCKFLKQTEAKPYRAPFVN